MNESAKENRKSQPKMQPHGTLSNGSWTNLLIRSGVVALQLVSLWVVYSLVAEIATKAYEASPPPALMSTVNRWAGLSRLYDLRLLTAIASYCGLFFVSQFFAYSLSLAYLALNASSMKWNHKCLSAALWENVLYKSYNLASFFACSTSCIGRALSGFSKSHHELIANDRERRAERLQAILPVIGLFIFLWVIRLRSIELAVFCLASVYLVTYSVFELLTIQLLRAKS